MKKEATATEWFVQGPISCESVVLHFMDRMKAGKIKGLRPRFRDELTNNKIPVVITGMELVGGVEGEFRVAFTGRLDGNPVTGNFEPSRGSGYMCLA